jgi:hypothetical protein
VHIDFELFELSYATAVGLTRRSMAAVGQVSFGRAKKRLILLLQKYRTMRKVVSAILAARSLYKDRLLGQLLNFVLNPDYLQTKVKTPLESAAMCRAIQVIVNRCQDRSNNIRV